MMRGMKLVKVSREKMTRRKRFWSVPDDEGNEAMV